jgi:Putative prokaryotic signal transducing protein
VSHGTDTRADSGTDEVRWAKAASFKASYEADLARQALEGEGIPVAVLGDATGIFGPGYMGPTTRGNTVLVPSDRVEEARELISDLIEAFGGGTGEDEQA